MSSSSSSSNNNNNNDYSIAKVSEIAAVSHKLLVALWGRSKHEDEVILIQGRSENYAFGGVHDSIFPTKWAWFVLNHAHFDVIYFIKVCNLCSNLIYILT